MQKSAHALQRHARADHIGFGGFGFYLCSNEELLQAHTWFRQKLVSKQFQKKKKKEEKKAMRVLVAAAVCALIAAAAHAVDLPVQRYALADNASAFLTELDNVRVNETISNFK